MLVMAITLIYINKNKFNKSSVKTFMITRGGLGGPTAPIFTFLESYICPYDKVKVKSCYNPLRLGTVIVLVSSGINFVNTPRLYRDRATR